MRSIPPSAIGPVLALAVACSGGSRSSTGAAGTGAAPSSAGGAAGTRASGSGFDASAPRADAGSSAAGSGGASATGGAGAAGHAADGGGGASGNGAGGALGAGATGGSGAPDAGAPQTIDHLVTFYGWPDNSPPGNGIAYPKLHKGASGTGTYADPITFASDPNEWPPGTILYLPYLERYVIMEDSCADCMTDWKNGKRHIDVWLDSDGRLDSQVLACENALTRDKTAVEVMPPADRPVNATPLFDQAAGTCNAP